MLGIGDWGLGIEGLKIMQEEWRREEEKSEEKKTSFEFLQSTA